MNKNEKLKLIKEEVFEIFSEELDVNRDLSSIDTWDSMAALVLISVCEEYFNRTDLDGNIIKNFKTVEDILNFLE